MTFAAGRRWRYSVSMNRTRRLAVWLLPFAAIAAVLALSFTAGQSGSIFYRAADVTHVMAPARPCTWSYRYYLNNPNATGSYAQYWVTSSNCGSGWPQYRAELDCVYPRGGAQTIFYGAWERPSAKSTAHCNSSSEPNWLDDQERFYNGLTATYRDWTR